MGTPDFAVGVLRRIVETGWEVAAVVTAPDKPAGRGRKVQFSAVKDYATTVGLPLLQPTNLKHPETVASLAALQADVFVVVAFRMLPEVVWRLPRLGTFNLHASLLPNYRGAAPIHWAVMNGETETGVTTFFIDQQIDTGQLLLQTRCAIPSDWNTGDLHDHLMHLGADLVVATLAQLQAGTLHPQPQDASQILHHAPKLNKANTRVEWQRPATDLYNFVRGLAPFPLAWTTLGGEVFKLHAAALWKGEVPAGLLPGHTFRPAPGQLAVVCGQGALVLTEVQPAAKRKMPVRDFLNGWGDSPLVFV
jgi:methionyl-tRNA formyltransferase